MSKSVRIAIAAALLLGGTSLATAKTRGGPARTAIHLHPGINEITSRPTVADPYYRLADPYYGGYSDASRPTVADPYYRLSDSYYGYSDPYHGLFDFYAVPPYNPGYSYGHVRPGGWR
jgi:hypothetical protein